MAKKEKKGKKLWAEFKEFINRGNAFMLAVGVVIGGAFSAIVNAFVSMLMSIATWAVPGGLKGLVTVLPAVNATQEGVAGIGQKFELSDDARADTERIQAIYEEMHLRGRHPEGYITH